MNNKTELLLWLKQQIQECDSAIEELNEKEADREDIERLIGKSEAFQEVVNALNLQS